MKKSLFVLLALLMCFALPLMAQEEDMDKGEMAEMAPPPPLDDAFLMWLAGEWKGTSESPMGKSEDWMKCDMGLGGQYLLVQVKSEGPMGPYSGQGAYTVREETVEGVWIDSWRDKADGEGQHEGNTLTMAWEGKMGKGTQVMEKVSDDKLKVSGKWEMPDGTVMESTGEFTRVKAMSGH